MAGGLNDDNSRSARIRAKNSMYTAHFGLGENPFSITPDPHFLYLSARHREALAHLLYGAGEAGGFVQITGEIGTGKTTVCRAFLEQLPERVDVALILNPALTAPELLQAICTELRVAMPAQRHSVRALIDAINAYLLETHARGRRTVLIVDEAQNLRPAVLEQIRLLTNLETHKLKLLQIFLLGQPELRELLARPELRQLAQRITARYHLVPLTRRETADYVHHRLAVAGCNRRIFSAAALRRLYRESRGIPRLINILCDRALLGAYAQDHQRVGAATVHQAARELRGEPRRHPALRWGATAALVLAAIGALAISAPRWGENLSERLAGLTGAPAERSAERRAAESTPHPAAEPAPLRVGEEPSAVATLSPTRAAPAPSVSAAGMTQADAEQRLLAAWTLPSAGPRAGGLCEQAAAQGLRCHAASGRWADLRQINRPALLELEAEEGRRHALLVRLDDDTAALEIGGEPHSFPLEAVERHWTGAYLLLWRPPLPQVRLIAPGSSGEAVRWLRRSLDRIEGAQVPAPAEADHFDTLLAERVRAFQHARGLDADALVGRETMVRLSGALPDPSAPRLHGH
jgi:general secretion pathway protein A